MSGFGTEAQEVFAQSLIARTAFTGTLFDAATQALGRAIGPADLPLAKTDASAVITWLQAKLPPETNVKSSQDTPPAAGPSSDAPRPRIFTARQLRRIATQLDPTPADLDEDAKWILIQIQRLHAITHLVAGARDDQKLAVNGDEHIKTDQMRHYFGSDEVAAEAFGISVGTFRSWGVHIPPQQESRAEVMTNGYVRAPIRKKV